LFLTLPTRVFTGQQIMSFAGWGVSMAVRRAGSVGSSPSHSDHTSGLRTTGVRLWSSAHRSLTDVTLLQVPGKESTFLSPPWREGETGGFGTIRSLHLLHDAS
jgi:hypothetical protein